MNWLDIVVIVMLVLGGFMGMRYGLISAAFTAAGVYIGWLFAGQYSDDLGALFADSVNNDTVVTVISYAIIIIAAVVASRIAGRVLRPILTVVTLGLSALVDKLGGLAMGVAVAGIIAGALITGLARFTYNFDMSQVTDEGVVGDIAGQALERLPDVEKTRESVEKALLESSMVPTFLDVARALPADAFGLIPADFRTALDILESKLAEKTAS